MRDAHMIILAPLVTEKTSRLAEKANVVAFKVRTDANKIEIRAALKKIWKVDAVSVRTVNSQGKLKRMGRFEGRRASWKKAIVTLAEGQAIPELTA